MLTTSYMRLGYWSQSVEPAQGVNPSNDTASSPIGLSEETGEDKDATVAMQQK